MAILNNVVRNFETVSATSGVVFADGDNSLFLAGTAELYGDAGEYLKQSSAEAIMLVSANPDDYLANDRLAAIQAAAPNVATTGEVHPAHMRWDKAPLYREAAKEFPDIATGLIIDDRWFAGLVRAMHGIKAAQPHMALETFCMRRHDSRGDTKLDPVIRTVEHAAFGLVARSGWLRSLVVDNHPLYTQVATEQMLIAPDASL